MPSARYHALYAGHLARNSACHLAPGASSLAASKTSSIGTLEDLEGARRGHRWRHRRRGHGSREVHTCPRHARERLRPVMATDALDPAVRALVQPEGVAHQPPAGDQDAEVGALVAPVARAADAQEERLALARDGAAMIVEAGVFDLT